MIEDLKFIIRCHGNTKEVRKRKSEEDILREVLEEFQPVSPYASTAVPVPPQEDQANATPANLTNRRKMRKKSSTPNAGTGTTSSSDRAV